MLPGALFLLAAVAVDDKPAFTPAQLVEVASACVAATNGTGVDREVLAKLGWVPTKATSADGKEITGPTNFFAKPDNAAVIILKNEGGDDGRFCTAFSPTLASRDQYKPMREAMTAQFGTPAINTDFMTVWNSDGDMIGLTSSNNPAKPGFMLGTRQATEGNK